MPVNMSGFSCSLSCLWIYDGFPVPCHACGYGFPVPCHGGGYVRIFLLSCLWIYESFPVPCHACEYVRVFLFPIVPVDM